MAGKVFSRVFPLFERYRGMATGLVFLVLALSALSFFNLKFDNTLDLMLPAGSPATKMMAFLRTANFSNKIVISIEDRGSDGSKDRLFAAVDRIAGALKPPLVSRVTKGFSAPDLMSDAGFFLRYAPQILGSNDLASIDLLLTPEGVDGVMKARYMQLLKPEGMFVSRAMQSDPLDINRLIFNRLQELSGNLGYAVKVEDGHFLSKDGRHAMLIVESPVSVTDVVDAGRLLDYLGEQTRGLPPELHVSFISGYSHTVSNEATIKRDLGVILTLASVGFTLVFILFFRDFRSLVVFLIPALSVVIATALTWLLFPKMSYFVLAFGPVIAGIADDYGIATYVAVRYGRNRLEAVGRIAMPVTVGAVATAGIFLAFFFSGIPGYQQLGFFCVASIFLSLFLALFIMPPWFKMRALSETADSAAGVPGVQRRKSMILAALFGVFLAVAGLLACRIRFDSDVTRLDGTAQSILDDEKSFKEVWGNGEKSEALLAVVGTDYERVMELNDEVYAGVSAAAGSNNIASFSSLWPSRRVREENAARWNGFWRSGRDLKLRSLIAEKGAAYGFTSNAFDPFFSSLSNAAVAVDEPASNRVFTNIKERFVQSSGSNVQVLSYFRDTPGNISQVEQVINGRPDVFIVSRGKLSSILSSSFSKEIVRTSCIAVVFIVLITFLFLRTVKSTLVALIPAVAGVTGLLAVMAALGMPLNVSNLISGIVVFGLCIDFGIHVLHACQHQAGKATRTAITLAATTTLMGAGVLLFAKHPALYSIGVTLVAGVGLGYVASMWIVPAFHSLLWKEGGK